jgi:hypothetical protein
VTMPPLPAAGDTSWREDWAKAVHDAAAKVTNDTFEARTAANERAIRVADYGTLGTADDSATINAALAAANGRRLVFPPNATLTVGESTATNLSNAVIDGNGCTLQLNATGARIAALRVSGTCENLEIRNLRVKGNGLVVDAHAGIFSSGATLRDIRVVDCHIRDVTLGISFAADGAGSLVGLLYQNNHVENVVGTTSGYGYGLHWSISDTVNPSGVRCVGNTIISAQRHSIYCAKTQGATILGNHLLNHRDANKDSTILPALMVLRSANVSIVGNVVQRPAGGGIYLGGPAPSTIAGPYEVIGNTFSDPQDAATLAYIGQQAPATEGIPQHVDFAFNTLTSPAAPKSLMVVWNGKHLRVANNRFQMAAGGGFTALTLQGLGVTGNDYLDHLDVAHNRFDIDTSSAIRLSPGADALTSIMRFRGNRRTDANPLFIVSAAVTNPNIDVQDQPRTGLTLSSGVSTARAFTFGPAQTTAPAAGTAGALPSAPAGYLGVSVNGTNRLIPYY